MIRFKEASFYKKLPNKKVRCKLCPHNCIIDNGEVGKCKVRQNVDGNLKAMNYGKIYMNKIKRVEGVPLFHFFPGKQTLFLSSIGGNTKGDWYQNETSGKDIEEVPFVKQSPLQINKEIEKKNIDVICYGYNEPLMYYEYIEDIINGNKKTKHIIKTNAFVESSPIIDLSKKIDAAIIEIRSMTDEFYEGILDAKLNYILRATSILHDNGVWIEIVMPVIPGIHKELYDIRKLISWILNNLGPNIPLHFIPLEEDNELLIKARKIALDAGLNYVYSHTKDWKDGVTTYCPNCKKPLIVRYPDKIENNLEGSKCSCGKEVAGVWH